MRWMICGFCIAGLAAQEASRPKDEREYALVQQAIAERDAAKRLETLETWSKEYESSNLNKLRAQLFLRTYRETGPARKTVEAAEKLLALDPEDFSARYTLASLAPTLGETSEAALSRAEQLARDLLDGGIAAQFSEKERPESVPAEAWANARKEAHATSLRTLAWIAMQRNEHAAAEARLIEALGVDPASAQASYWLAQSVLAQRNPAKNELAFFSLARAATLTGGGELPAASREKIHSYLKNTYVAFAGTLDGLEDLERLAASSALPPADMPRILSADERKRIAEQQFCEDKPLECAYRTLRSALEGDSGAGIWEELRGKVSPQMRLYVVSNVPPDRPLELRMSSTKGGPSEVALRLENRLREAVPAGRALTVEGVASAFQREPFLLTLDRGKIVE